MSETSDWYVYEESGAHRGPFTSEELVAALKEGALLDTSLVAPDRWFESLGESGWRALRDVPELVALVEASVRAEERRHLKPPPRLVQGAYTTTARGTPEFGATAMITIDPPDGSED